MKSEISLKKRKVKKKERGKRRRRENQRTVRQALLETQSDPHFHVHPQINPAAAAAVSAAAVMA